MNEHILNIVKDIVVTYIQKSSAAEASESVYMWGKWLNCIEIRNVGYNILTILFQRTKQNEVSEADAFWKVDDKIQGEISRNDHPFVRMCSTLFNKYTLKTDIFNLFS